MTLGRRLLHAYMMQCASIRKPRRYTESLGWPSTTDCRI